MKKIVVIALVASLNAHAGENNQPNRVGFSISHGPGTPIISIPDGQMRNLRAMQETDITQKMLELMRENAQLRAQNALYRTAFAQQTNSKKPLIRREPEWQSNSSAEPKPLLRRDIGW